MPISKGRPLHTRDGAHPSRHSFVQSCFGVRETPPDDPHARLTASDEPHDESPSPTELSSLHDLLLPVLSDDSLDFRHIAMTAVLCHDRAAAGLKTIGQFLHLADRDGISTKAFLVADVGGLVAHLADYRDAMSAMEGYALYQLNRLRN